MKIFKPDHLAVGLCISGLLLAGSDGGWFPWANLFGLALLPLALLLARKALRDSEMAYRPGPARRTLP